jgi:hypothetical protein
MIFRSRPYVCDVVNTHVFDPTLSGVLTQNFHQLHNICPELTHHQRAHIKLNRTDMFGKRSGFFPAGIEISFDDKAYVRPGTDGNNIKMKRYTV